MELAIWLWGGLVIATLITEFVTDELVAIWFAAGAIVGLVLAIFGVPEWVQIVSFVGASTILLIATRPIVKKITKKPTIKTNADSLVGEKTHLLTEITEDDAGSVKFNGVVWTAVSEDKKTIEKGAKIEVVEIKGNKLVVKKGEDRR